MLFVRRSIYTGCHYPPRQLVPYLERAGFYGASCAGHFMFDNALVSALVERWRPETHTFHMSDGECTITLQDVAIQLGLPVDGHPVIGYIPTDVSELCRQCLGKVPTASDMRGNRIKLKWLANEFSDDSIPENATPQVLEQYTRAYILKLVGGLLFCDYTGTFVHTMFLPLIVDLDRCKTYSWGSTVLAFLYRELCQATDMRRTNIGGCIYLLHIWAWERFHLLAPKIKRRHKLVLIWEGKLETICI